MTAELKGPPVSLVLETGILWTPELEDWYELVSRVERPSTSGFGTIVGSVAGSAEHVVIVPKLTLAVDSKDIGTWPFGLRRRASARVVRPERFTLCSHGYAMMWPYHQPNNKRTGLAA